MTQAIFSAPRFGDEEDTALSIFGIATLSATANISASSSVKHNICPAVLLMAKTIFSAPRFGEVSGFCSLTQFVRQS